MPTNYFDDPQQRDWSAQPQRLQATLAAPTRAVLGTNPKRIGLLISSPATNRVTLGDTPGVTDQNGAIVLHVGNVATLYTRAHLGRLLTGHWFAVSAVADETFCVVELTDCGG